MGTCCVCQKTNATLHCGICKEDVCKKCAQFLEDGQFSYMTSIPADFRHTTYCGPCFDQKVTPALAEYEAMLEKAKGIVVFYKADSKETRHFRRIEKPYKVTDCADKDEVMMRLAYQTAEAGFNSILDVEVSSKKVLNGTYKTSTWSGVGIPAQITSKRFL
ncbi:MAG: hypothetical protein ACKOX6_10275 [Bdellovibrio sp.]